MSRSGRRPDLVLFNARAHTLDRYRPMAEMVAVEGGRISQVGADADLPALDTRGATLIDCLGQTLLPGFIDGHCHVLGYAASLLAVDCGPASAPSIDALKWAIRERAAHTPSGGWVRGTGYSEFDLRERRHPSKRDLDEAAPDHPVQLDHRSGHATVLNSAALDRVGIRMETPDPEGGVIERDPRTGEPTGLLMEIDEYLRGRLPPLSGHELRRGIEIADERLVSLGITSVQDATVSNSPDRWDLFGRLKAERAVRPRITMMAGSGHLTEFLDRGLRFGSGDVHLNLGAVKIMLTATAGALHPAPAELRAVVRQARESGFQVAVHAVEAESVAAAADALVDTPAGGTSERPHRRDRIEHCSECPPATLARLAASRVAVVTQPAFLYHSGHRYLRETDEEMLPWLYPIDSLVKAGLTVAAGSDAPVADPDPLLGVYAAARRRAKTGEVIGQSQRTTVRTAIEMYTVNGAYVACQETDKGSLRQGKLADLVLVDRDPTGVEPDQIPRIRVMLTVIGGEVVWRA